MKDYVNRKKGAERQKGSSDTKSQYAFKQE